jgi:hypothetical protein
VVTFQGREIKVGSAKLLRKMFGEGGLAAHWDAKD